MERLLHTIDALHLRSGGGEYAARRVRPGGPAVAGAQASTGSEKRLGLRTVIWATGYRRHIQEGGSDINRPGRFVHHRGRDQCPGLIRDGLKILYQAAISSVVDGVRTRRQVRVPPTSFGE